MLTIHVLSQFECMVTIEEKLQFINKRCHPSITVPSQNRRVRRTFRTMKRRRGWNHGACTDSLYHPTVRHMTAAESKQRVQVFRHVPQNR